MPGPGAFSLNFFKTINSGDGGLGAGWGINILSSDVEIEKTAAKFVEVCNNA